MSRLSHIVAWASRPGICGGQPLFGRNAPLRSIARAGRPSHAFMFIAVVLLIQASSPAAPTTVPAKGGKPREAIGQAGCVRDECHASVRNYAVVHGPVGVNACDACHELADAQSHTFRFVREKVQMCTYCHEFDVSAMPVVHKPVKEGQCLGCHDPHGGTNKALIRENSIEELCNRCHEKITTGKTFLHAPVKQGACDSCHPAHASRFPKLVDLAGPDLCLACHEEFAASMAKVKFTHKALEKGCEKCHDVHGSKHANATTQPIIAQCGGCHEKVTTAARAARYPHTPVMSDERACTNCHTPHGSSLAKLVSDSPDKLCMSCHKTEQKTNRGYVVPAVAELMDEKLTKHGGIKDGSCAGCHVAHGSNQQLFLTRHYSKIFYQKFSPQQYELCFSCHDLKLVTEEKTAKLTNFRNGERNLHTLHVRDTKERGENCRVCHNNHSGDNAVIVRPSITYGTWTMPIRYTKTQTGGSCYPGCHPIYRYDRSVPVKNVIGVATTAPAVASIVGERPSGVTIDMSDVLGRTVKGPDGSNAPIVVAAMRADQVKETDDVLARLQATLKDASAARMIVIVNGATAAARAASLASSRQSIQFIADADGSMCGELEVHGFPTVLVLRGDGLETARIAGEAETLSVRLPPYLDLAAGKITPAGATTRISAPDIVADSKTARDIRMIERLLDTAKADDAMELLMKLPDGALPAWRHNLLGARALMGLNRWPEAKDAALTALQQQQSEREIHAVLGQIYEHEQDWPHAAAEYRAANSAR